MNTSLTYLFVIEENIVVYSLGYWADFHNFGGGGGGESACSMPRKCKSLAYAKCSPIEV